MFTKLICWVKGHKRGKPIAYFNDATVYACPRCHAEYTRKTRKAKGAA